MKNWVTITLLGRPVPGNERHRTKTGIRFLPTRQADALAVLKLAAAAEMDGKDMLVGPLSMSLSADLPIPSSWSKKRQAGAAEGAILPTSRPDLKNLLWLAEDAMTKIVYNDDSQICVTWMSKRYSKKPQLSIWVGELITEDEEQKS